MTKFNLFRLKNEMLDKASILNAIRNAAALSAEAILETVFNVLAQFIGAAKIEDDITAVVIKQQS
jgi:serine phosphatase RsbU (regulator of sigma subunit)